ncbi:protein FAR1-RELATED SEQUENCE 2-like isoform X1 [Cucurbita moschata]|uniref:Protein FAR1-RELATED SEQUENCE n=1 Tax=Cucurbita moschata TaxID=3662 RepID=A0A6J1FN86_CUCMO|nr:protein FAR1-RELATED SEQUENCE 2-like isoform X1 [Cucurbita moschata]XP_022940058.1 protein FAR1-RELATED SEQUENCE 2-like isoform X1 [Cucurbita moschata]XP_022940059.1 protein FAR1-RELATED SEQUENCE 2-like isoform X1 [Cucurbita moschata]
MDIDLELPSSDQERLGILESKNDGMDLDQTHGEGRAANSPTRAELSQGMSIPNTETNSVRDQMDIVNVGINHIMGPAFEPKIGLEFESKEEAYSFYREYARFVGFGITIKASRRSKRSGKFIDIKIACSRFGSKRESTTTVKPRPCMKTGCDASIHIKKREDGKWFVHGFIREHNHEICPDDFHYALKGKNKNPDIIASEKNGLQLALDEGDVHLMLEHFMHMQEMNPNFFYAVDFNQEKQLRSVLWVDAKARHDYKNFSDVIFFDTHYISSGYQIPFVPIVGVNHHFQYVLFGGALIGDIATSSLIWLMKTWLKAVGGPAPTVVLTDRESFLKEAVADVFPKAIHLFSLWHILTRVREKLGKIIDQNRNFMESFDKCIYGSWRDEEFEKKWWEMVEKFEVKENEWLQLLFDDHKKWVPAYVKNYFLAGMCTSERSGSVASFFDNYISKEATFKEFVERSEIFSKDMLELEADADFETRHQEPALKCLSPFEQQTATIYVTTIFKKFQLEVVGAASCRVHEQTEDGAIVTYQVDDLEEQQKFLVAWNKAELDIRCRCRSFEHRGILCRHAILVLQVSGVTSIPQKYILKRWTRNAKVRLSESSNRLHYRVARFNHLCKQAIRLSEVGSLSRETYDIAFDALEDVLKQCVFVNNSNKSFAETNMVSVGFVDVEDDDRGEDMAKSSRKKKTIKKGKITKQARYKSSEAEVDSRAAALDGCTNSPFCDGPEGYYSLQAMQSLDQSPSVVARVGPRDDRQTIQSLGQLNPREPGAQGRFDIENNLQDMLDDA